MYSLENFLWPRCQNLFASHKFIDAINDFCVFAAAKVKKVLVNSIIRLLLGMQFRHILNNIGVRILHD